MIIDLGLVKKNNNTNMITLQQDADRKLKTTIDEGTLEMELKRYFGWRTPTKRYKTMRDRFDGLGTGNHDKFISYLVTGKY